ncbi:MAG: 2OG-Fe(II) oxygenase [Gammaproteobacteria bacterium]
MSNEYLTSVGQFPAVFSPDECRRLIALPLPVVEAGVDSRSPAGERVDYEFRRTLDRPVPPDEANAWIFQRLRNLARAANQQAYHFQLNDDMTVNLLEYNPDGFFDWHLDLGAGLYSERKLSMVTFLTPPEEYEGGELCFMDRGAPLRLAQGATAIFPSYLLHRVVPVTRGTRFTMVSWLHGPSFS